jgi:GNAT superfamily N-acetyltransferase
MADADAITELTQQLGYDVAASALAPRLTRILSRSDQQLFVAEVDGTLAGWIHAIVAEYLEADVFLVIGGLVVDRRHRRRGIGRVLIEHAEAWGLQRGCRLVRVWSSVARRGAHRFYEGLGYVKVKTQHSFAKPLGVAGADVLRGLAPTVREEEG